MIDLGWAMPGYVVPGASVRLHGRLWHVRAIVDGDMVVCRTWRHRRWEYEIYWAYFFYLAEQSDSLRLWRAASPRE